MSTNETIRERTLQSGDVELYAEQDRGILWFRRGQTLMSGAHNKTNPRVEGTLQGSVLNIHVRFPLAAILNAEAFGIDRICVKAFDLIKQQIPVYELQGRYEEKWSRGKQGVTG